VRKKRPGGRGEQVNKFFLLAKVRRIFFLRLRLGAFNWPEFFSTSLKKLFFSLQSDEACRERSWTKERATQDRYDHECRWSSSSLGSWAL
jgi:hypothetical protein